MKSSKIVSTHLLILVFTLSSFCAYAQNVIPNGGFEQYTTCPSGNSQVGGLNSWHNLIASPDYFNSCNYSGNGTINGTPLTGNGVLGHWGYPSFGSCPGAAYVELVYADLTSPMIPNVNYTVEFSVMEDPIGTYTSGTNACLEYGMYFYNSTDNLPINSYCCMPLTPQAATNTANIIEGTYTTFTFNFTPTQAFNRVMLGAFCNSVTPTSACSNAIASRMYFNADDVSTFPTVVLPVELLSFTGQNKGKVNLLKWVSTLEENSSHYELQRCITGCDDLNNYTTISTHNMQGGNEEQSYHHTDTKPFQGLNHYILKVFDLDGTATFSDVVTIDVLESQFYAEVLPNPIQDNGELRIHMPASSVISVKCMDSKGRIVSSQRHTLDKGNHILPLKMDELAAGVYFLQLRDEHMPDVYTVKLVKQ